MFNSGLSVFIKELLLLLLASLWAVAPYQARSSAIRLLILDSSPNLDSGRGVFRGEPRGPCRPPPNRPRNFCSV